MRLRKISIFWIILIATVFSFCVVYAQTATKMGKKTVKLSSGQQVLDLRGEWDGIHEFPGMTGYTIIIEMTQEGKTFMGIRLQETQYWPKGTEAIKGELQGDGFKAVSINRADLGWTPCKWEISKNGNKILLNDEGVVKLTLIRR
jgi:hypothetical protein